MSNFASVGVFICSRVVGGHEHQMAEIVKDLSLRAHVTIYLNSSIFKDLFSIPSTTIVELPNKLLATGKLPVHFWNGLRLRRFLKHADYKYDFIIVSAGAVEAGLTVGLAFWKRVPMYLYLPFFYDRIPCWGKFFGFVYNQILIHVCKLFDFIITINRIQAHVLTSLTGIKTVIVPNLIRDVSEPILKRAGKLVFIGRLDHQKRVDELLQWIDFPENPYGEILIMGDGPLRKNLENTAHQMEYIKATFTGWLSPEDQDRTLVTNDVLLLNSQLEGEPLVIREAKRRGMNILGRDIIGLRGITRPTMRYKSCEELRMKLVKLNPKDSYNFKDCNNLDHRLNYRHLAIERLINGYYFNN